MYLGEKEEERAHTLAHATCTPRERLGERAERENCEKAKKRRESRETPGAGVCERSRHSLRETGTRDEKQEREMRYSEMKAYPYTYICICMYACITEIFSSRYHSRMTQLC